MRQTFARCIIMHDNAIWNLAVVKTLVINNREAFSETNSPSYRTLGILITKFQIICRRSVWTLHSSNCQVDNAALICFVMLCFLFFVFCFFFFFFFFASMTLSFQPETKEKSVSVKAVRSIWFELIDFAHFLCVARPSDLLNYWSFEVFWFTRSNALGALYRDFNFTQLWRSIYHELTKPVQNKNDGPLLHVFWIDNGDFH